MSNKALALFDYAGLALSSDTAGTVFTSETKPVLNKEGKQVGSTTTLKLRKATEARETLQLKGKDNKEEWERQQKLARVYAFKRTMAHLASLDADQLGLMRFSQKTGADGLLDMSLRIKQVRLKEDAHTLDEIIDAFFPNMPREEAREKALAMFAKSGTRPKGMDVSSEVVPPKAITEGVEDLQKEAIETERQAQASAQAEANADAPKSKGKK